MKIFGIEWDDIKMLNQMNSYDEYGRELLGIYTKSIRYFVYVKDELLNAIFAAYQQQELTPKQKKLLDRVANDQGISTAIASFEYCYYVDGTTKYMYQDGMK